MPNRRMVSKAQTEKKRIVQRKQDFLVAFKNKLGNVSLAATAVGITRACFYQWYNDDQNFAEEVESIRESHLDFAESKLLQKISEGDTTCLIFFLKTKGGPRGWTEKYALEHSGASNIAGINITIYRTNPNDPEAGAHT